MSGWVIDDRCLEKNSFVFTSFLILLLYNDLIFHIYMLLMRPIKRFFGLSLWFSVLWPRQLIFWNLNWKFLFHSLYSWGRCTYSEYFLPYELFSFIARLSSVKWINTLLILVKIVLYCLLKLEIKQNIFYMLLGYLEGERVQKLSNVRRLSPKPAKLL